MWFWIKNRCKTALLHELSILITAIDNLGNRGEVKITQIGLEVDNN